MSSSPAPLHDDSGGGGGAIAVAPPPLAPLEATATVTIKERGTAAKDGGAVENAVDNGDIGVTVDPIQATKELAARLPPPSPRAKPPQGTR